MAGHRNLLVNISMLVPDQSAVADHNHQSAVAEAAAAVAVVHAVIDVAVLLLAAAVVVLWAEVQAWVWVVLPALHGHQKNLWGWNQENVY